MPPRTGLGHFADAVLQICRADGAEKWWRQGFQNEIGSKHNENRLQNFWLIKNMLSLVAHWASSPYSIALLIAAVTGIVQLFSYGMACSSKWRDYALHYASPNRPEGTAYVVRWASFGKRGNRCKYSYGKCVRVIFTEPGVYFCMGFILGVFHRPFLMPWNKVNRIERYDGPFYRKYMLMIEEGPDEIYLEMMSNGEENLKKFYKKNIGAGEPRLELPQRVRPY